MPPALQEIVLDAFDFATTVHEFQRRKYTHDLYFTHCVEVMELVQNAPAHTAEMLAAALLHDVMTHHGYDQAHISMRFGSEVARLVWWVSDLQPPDSASRSKRLDNYRAKLLEAPSGAKTIKLADLISDCRQVIQHGTHEEARDFVDDMSSMLGVLKDGSDPLLYRAAEVAIDGFYMTTLYALY